MKCVGFDGDSNDPGIISIGGGTRKKGPINMLTQRKTKELFRFSRFSLMFSYEYPIRCL